MIPIIDAKELREQLDTLLRASKLLAESFENSEAGDDTISEDMLVFMEDRTDNVRDIAMGLARAIARLQGRAEGKWAEPRNDPWLEIDDSGNKIVSITPGTATCTEFGRSFAIPYQSITPMARRLGIHPAGEVTWEKIDGTKAVSNTYDLAAWTTMKDRLVKQRQWSAKTAAQVCPPPRLVAHEEEKNG